MTSRERDNRKRGPVRETRAIYLRLPVDMADEIRNAAQERGWTINRWFETLLEATLTRPKAPAKPPKKKPR